jgi:hypothetical protein
MDPANVVMASSEFEMDKQDSVNASYVAIVCI